jgi:DNA-binding response OmpR family regulator
MPHIVLVETDAGSAAYLRAHLEADGHSVEELPTGRALLARLTAADPVSRRVDLAAFVLQLPDVHGFQVVRELRAGGVGVAIIVTSECGEEAHRVRGLRLGADDFLVKPFGVTEFLARVEAVLRRTAGGPAAAPLGVTSAAAFRFAGIEIDTAARVVRRLGSEVPLVPKEFDLLVALARRDGAVATRAALLQEIWGYDESVTSRTVDSHVAGLRQKLEDDARAPRHIVTVYRTGYRLRR